MAKFSALYIPATTGTFHMETAEDQFRKSIAALKGISESIICPKEKLIGSDAVKAFIKDKQADLVIFQNLTFANGAFISEVLKALPHCPVLLWTLREPVIDGGRLRLNSLTGAYSAANTMINFNQGSFSYVFGAPDEERTVKELSAVIKAAEVIHNMHSLKMAAIGQTPQGFGFGRALDADLMSSFGVELEAIEARQLIGMAKSYTDEEVMPYLEKTACATCGLDEIPLKNRLDHARLYKAYTEYIMNNGIGALASRCWPDFFTEFGTPVCTVLSMLNDDKIPSACECDVYGALSMWIGMQLSGSPVFFGDPVSLDEGENSITFWHCGAAACSLARKDTGAVIGVHPNRKIGPAMDFGCGQCDEATIFRIGRLRDGSFRFFIEEGKILDKPKQFTGTSVVVETGGNAREIVENSVKAGYEPHFVVMKGCHRAELEAIFNML